MLQISSAAPLHKTKIISSNNKSMQAPEGERLPQRNKHQKCYNSYRLGFPRQIMSDQTACTGARTGFRHEAGRGDAGGCGGQRAAGGAAR